MEMYMNYAKYIVAAMCLWGGVVNLAAQETVKVDDPWKDYPTKEELYKDYSRFSVGFHIGSPYLPVTSAR